ncbi:HAD-IC family P-type ATPase [Candidatus Bathyarchaeota archaeon]|nr:HAD-IC family P-type ATPase [Candidatus Bathyarchaeota archaeon]
MDDAPEGNGSPTDDVEFYRYSTQETYQKLETREEGLTEDEAKKRYKKYGPNELVEEKKTTALEIFVNQFKSILILILIAAAAVSGFILHEYTDMAVILIIVVLNSIIGFIQEYRAEQAVEALKQMVSPKCKVIRNDTIQEIPADRIVPGDILVIEEGDRIPADARLTNAVNLKIDESPLTGESTTVTKKPELIKEETSLAQRTNIVYMGTHATYGRGKAIITSTGMSTEFGNIAKMIQSIEEETSPLKKKTEKLGRQLGVIALIGCIMVFIVDYLNGISLVNSFLSAVSLAVSAIPEGLPTVLVITLSLGAQRMARQNAIVRKLNSVETLGTTTVICSDKTGTITKNEMTVRQVETENNSIDITGEGYTRDGKFIENGDKIKPRRNFELELILKTGLLCNNSSIVEDPEIGPYITGDPTEGAILIAAVKSGLIPEKVEKENPRVWELPFDSRRKMMSTINETENGLRVYAKGAPEVILEKSNQIYSNGAIKELTEKHREEIKDKVEELAERALRVLAFAYKETEKQDEYQQEETESDLIFIGLMGMMDPPREEVPAAIELCRKAGIRPVMITGDHEDTAVAIAREVGIITEGDSDSVTGMELSEMTDAELSDIVDKVSVYARVSPEHKVRIAQALRSKGNIVAMTGDGVNDAPAIKAADIGVAMGIKGTDVSKEAADMVLADDNFASIVRAVEQGRIIYDNIRKFMRFMISSNFDEMIVISSFVLAGLPMPFLPVMILWLNLVTDGGPAIALSMDKPTDDLMSIPPRDPKEGILHGMYLFIAAYVVLQSGSTAATFIWKYLIQGASLAASRTTAFMQACIFELVVVWNCRSENHNVLRTGFNNRYLLAATLIGGLLTISLSYVPFLQNVFHTVPLTLQDWAWIFGISLTGFLVLPELFFRNKEN